MKIRNTIQAALILTFGALCASPALAQGQGPALVAVDTVSEEPLSQTVPVLGRLVAIQRGTVAALTRGPVSEVHVNVGDRVREGDVLVTQATDRLQRSRDVAQQAVDAALAAVATARSQLELAEQERVRLERLRGSAAFSPAALDDKTFEVAVRRAQIGEAQAEVARARALLDEAQLDVDLGVIRAPFDGVVIDRHTVRGNYMNVGDPAVTLINDTYLEVEADVPAPRVAGLTEGREVVVLFANNVRYRAEVRAVLPEENALTRTRLVRFVPEIGGGLAVAPAAGQSVTVEIPIGEERTILSVHKDAILARNGQNSVALVQDDMTIAMVPVQLGEAVGERFEVLDGLADGDLVVVRGNERVRPGQPVTWPGAPVPAAPEEEGAGAEEAARSGSSG